ncbi:MAG: pilus assembly protein [Thermodesulfobacteriota bacterium]
MKKRICLSFLSLSILLMTSHPLFAYDTDLYTLGGPMEGIDPDVLFVLDLSVSMNWTPFGEFLYAHKDASCWYDEWNDTCKTVYCTKNCNTDGPFYPTKTGDYTKQVKADIDMILPNWSGSDKPPIYGNSACSGPFYKTPRAGYTRDCRRITIAKEAIKKILDGDGDGTVEAEDQNKLHMRFGYMRFFGCIMRCPFTDNGTDYGRTSDPDPYQGGPINWCPNWATPNNCNQLVQPLDTPYDQIWSSINADFPWGGTTVVASLQEAKLYLDDTKYGMPARGIPADLAKECRKKFAIILTDGGDTHACNPSKDYSLSHDWAPDNYKRRRETVAAAKALGDAGYMTFVIGFGDLPRHLKRTLNWAAYYAGTDNPSVPNSGNTSDYKIPTGQLYPTGISACSNSSITCYKYTDYIKNPPVKTACTQNTPGCYCFATKSGTAYNDPGELHLDGFAYFADSPASLEAVLTTIKDYIITIVAKSTSYVAPVVPISQMDSASSGDRMYLAMFKPKEGPFWKGNLKKYGIATENTENYNLGDIVDASTPPQAVMDGQNRFKAEAKSYWSSAADGGDVDKGGAGEVLLNRSFTNNPRQIYTYLDRKEPLVHPNNAFATNNTWLTPTLLGLDPMDTTGKNKIINFIHGYDVYDEDRDGLGPNLEEKRDWILGAFIHSKPVLVYYPSKKNPERATIYAGANDGMLHAFDNDTGEERWAFIPPSLLPNLKYLTDKQNRLQIFVDGSPRVYLETDSSGNMTLAYLIFGLRRGGYSYIALNVTQYDRPEFLWEINRETPGFGELGQTWSTPKLGKIKVGTTEKWVLFIGGGYDTNQDNVPVTAADTKGRAVYVVDVKTGALVWSWTYSQDPTRMIYSIPSDITTLDVDGDGFVDRLYVGDMGGRVWRFDIGDPSTSNWTAKIVFNSNAPTDGKRKIFYPPDVTLERGDYEMLFFGTGDRENPTGTSSVNRLYAVKDDNPSSPLTESDLVDVTSNLLQSPSASESDKTAFLNLLRQKKGYFITLENAGEKCLAPAIVVAGAAYYTTFTPSVADPNDICFLGEGTARLYALDYQLATAVLNLDVTNDTERPVLRKTDRSLIIGTGIASGVVITVSGGRQVVGYTGVSGGVASPEIPNKRVHFRINWKLLF